MGKAYSRDLRERVIDAVMKEGMSCRAAAARFGIGESSAIRWVDRFRRTNSRDPVGTGGHRPSKTKPHRIWLLSLIENEHDLTLESISERFLAEKNVRADTSMLSRFYAGEGIRCKKKRSSQRTGQAGRETAA